MIKLNNLNKYFNKGKQNEIHVINNTTLEFPKKGLISLLGESGSGKTTLLNVIGGLDKTSGSITFKDEEITSYNSKIWDKIRVNNIGYIFQNYYLLEDRTVYDNIKIVLTMMGINDSEEIDFRVTYVLEAVGMYRFRNKLASDLSGGQKQRVAIARAIVKNPDVIIADEPTGNLDSNNSIEVLKIIKEISKDKLVILVTHNINLAFNYSDRIIKIVDGSVVSDEQNISGTRDLEFVDTNIYLKDLNTFGNENIAIYSNENLDDLALKIVKIDNNYYLQTNEKNVTVKVINDQSEVRLLDEHKKDVDETFTKETTFNLEELESKNKGRTKKSVYTFKDSILEAFKKLANLGRKGKIQIVALVYLGISFGASFLLFTSAIFLDTSDIYIDKNIYEFDVFAEDINYDDISDYIFFGNYYYQRLKTGNFTQTLQGLSVLPKEVIGKENTDKDIVYIDQSVLDKDYPYYYIFESFGITKKEHFKNQKIILNSDIELTIDQTINTNTKSIYVDKEILLDIQASMNYPGIKLYDDNQDLVINQALTPPEMEGKYGVYISEKLYDLQENVRLSLPNTKIAGYFVDDSDEDDFDYYSVFYFKRDDYKRVTIEDFKYLHDFNIYIPEGKNIPNYLNNLYEQELLVRKENKQIALGSSVAQALIALSISVLIFYFLVRSSMTKRRKEISILRSLGISKNEVRRLFAVEYFILTTTTSLVGVLIGAYVARAVQGSFLGDFFNIRVGIIPLTLTIVLMYAVNILISLIPVNKMVRKTPADLLTNYDI